MLVENLPHLATPVLQMFANILFYDLKATSDYKLVGLILCWLFILQHIKLRSAWFVL